MDKTRRVPSRLSRALRIYRNTVERGGIKQIPRLTAEFLARSSLGQRARMHLSGSALLAKKYRIDLPPGLSAKHVHVHIAIPALPSSPYYEFTEHPLERHGEASSIVLATTKGGFAISPDLGESWQPAHPRGYTKHEIVHAKYLGGTEYLLQAILPAWKRREALVDTIVVNAAGAVLAENRIAGSPWHGCRGVDMRGDTLMFAEYPYETPGETPGQRRSRRVFRSRDSGRSWQVVFEVPGATVRHFHFLQARPGRMGEWWLASGDYPEESHVWVSRDDGDTWQDESSPLAETVNIDGIPYTRSVFRLTDMAWFGDQVLWGTDQVLPRNKKSPRGARVFQSPANETLAPALVGTAQWEIRNVVDVGDFFVLLSQGPGKFSDDPGERRPNVFLVPKDSPRLIHLLDVDVYSSVPTGFTYSKASRAAKDGVFFTSRSGTDVFPFGHKVLKWEFRFF